MQLFRLSGRMVPEYELNEVRELIEGGIELYICSRQGEVQVLSLLFMERAKSSGL